MQKEYFKIVLENKGVVFILWGYILFFLIRDYQFRTLFFLGY